MASLVTLCSRCAETKKKVSWNCITLFLNYSYHVLAHGQQCVVERCVCAFLMRTLLGHQIVDETATLLQHSHLACVSCMLLCVRIPMRQFAAKIEAGAHGKVGTDGMYERKVFRCAKHVSLGLGNLTLGCGQLQVEVTLELTVNRSVIITVTEIYSYLRVMLALLCLSYLC